VAIVANRYCRQLLKEFGTLLMHYYHAAVSDGNPVMVCFFLPGFMSLRAVVISLARVE
jgi:hypothetical protein